MSIEKFEAAEPLRAVAYVRMSTDRQIHSTENQMDAIAAYAARKNVAIVRTYKDGKSGLSLDRRPALKSLLGDVMLGKADFDCILVYDVSRWGRFQNSDESAHYEFICKEAGVRVEYCAEEFSNDGSLLSNVMKSLKRAMAAEYSRELSTKVFAAQRRLIAKGFRQGGAAGYGLRRLLLDQNGQPKGMLEPGQRKHLQSDRVILQPGPEGELAVVREIFRQFVFELQSESLIARELNREGILNRRGCPWTHRSVRYVLNNENYMGVNVYNRKTCRLGSKLRNNSPNLWVRAPCAFEPIVDPEIFDRAQRHRKQRRIKLSNREMLARLESLLREKGRLSATLINEANYLPDNSTYALRFGSLRNAYKLINYRPRANFRYIDRGVFLAAKIRETATGLIKLVEQGGGSAVFDEAEEIVSIDGAVTVSIYVARCTRVPGGGLMWRVNRRRYLQGDWIVALRPDLRCRTIIDFLLLPTSGFPKQKAEFSDRNPARLVACRHESMASLLPLILAPPKEQYVPLAPHSSTRCGKAKVFPKPGRRRTSSLGSNRRRDKNEGPIAGR
jgi:DNA invertase Pin-like site-specific DNA recombinase